ERTNAGHLLERTSDTLRIVGRETRFMGLAADARGHLRMLRDPMHPSFAGHKGGESLPTPFYVSNSKFFLFELGQEFVIDFLLNLAVYGIVNAVNGTPFDGTDVAQAALV